MSEIITCFEGLTIIEVIEDDLSLFLSDDMLALDTSEEYWLDAFRYLRIATGHPMRKGWAR